MIIIFLRETVLDCNSFMYKWCNRLSYARLLKNIVKKPNVNGLVPSFSNSYNIHEPHPLYLNTSI